MIDEYFKLWNSCRGAFRTRSVWERAARLGTGSLLCLGRHSVTGLISATGMQDKDWSADYRVFEKERIDGEMIFGKIREEVISRLPDNAPLVTFMDDTLMRKKGRKVSGTAWKRDPNGPKFCNNFIWATRFLQISGALEEEDRPGSCRGIPFILRHSPTPKRPSRKAPGWAHDEYEILKKEMRISVKGAEAIKDLRASMDSKPESSNRELVVNVDGSYTNKTVIRELPPRTTLIGRIRKDAKLYSVPVDDKCSRRGRKRYYGELLPTPEKTRQDDDISWTEVKAFASDRIHTFKIKFIPVVRSRIGGERDMSLLIVQPLHYRLSKKTKLLYRNPAYLICTDTSLSPEKILQWYLWRWQIEVNFRDQKSLIGMEEASVWTAGSIKNLPQLIAISYAFMQLSFTKNGQERKTVYKLPKWRRNAPLKRLSTCMMISEMRNQIWGLGIGSGNLSHFRNSHSAVTKLVKFTPSLEDAVYYAHR